MEIRNSLLEASVGNRDLLQKQDKCDRYGYLISVACGVLGGFVDIFLVGAPGDSILGKWTDAQVDSVVKTFAKQLGWNPKEAQKDNVASAIGFLERNFRVNYDQTSGKDVNNLVDLSNKNHHMKSIGHSPDIIGLFFSILNQFTSTSSFIKNRQIITIKTETFDLQGHNFVSKIFCGIVNWIGHLMSDIAGSTGSRGNGGRGMGIVIPFYELLQFCKFGKFNVGKDKQDLSTIAIRAFEEGYDLRFGLATAIPVMITDLSIRVVWSLRQRFQYGKPLNECIPSSKNSDLRVMLLFGNGTLCIIDGLDAGIRSGGNALLFFTRMNLIAWFHFIKLVLKEVCIRVNVANSISSGLNAFIQINEALRQYLNELEKIDIELFRKETEKYNSIVCALENITSEEELNHVLLENFEKFEIKKPWEGDFNEHMANKQGRLVFE